eukprot:m.245859 g.245859  ORF g.245859 m.245859 type:complete len:90 (-) comp15369_c3_seq1:56-325(-)
MVLDETLSGFPCTLSIQLHTSPRTASGMLSPSHACLTAAASQESLSTKSRNVSSNSRDIAVLLSEVHSHTSNSIIFYKETLVRRVCDIG